MVKAGKVRYIGASSMYAWQFAKALYLAQLHGWTRFVSMQNHYNLLYREEEREMMGLCAEEGVAVIPWSPLARGRLTRAWQSETTKRSETDRFGNTMYSRTEEARKSCRPAWRDRCEARCAAGAGRTGVDAEQARGNSADSRCNEAASFEGCSCGDRFEVNRQRRLPRWRSLYSSSSLLLGFSLNGASGSPSAYCEWRTRRTGQGRPRQISAYSNRAK